MSYISEISPASLARSNTSFPDNIADRTLPDAQDSPSVKLAAGLEIAILLAMLSGLSLAFCTIAAGAL